MIQRKLIPGLVAIEGIDGSGKASLTKSLEESLKAESVPVKTGHEPTSGPIGRVIRDYLHSVPEADFSPEALCMLFAADRMCHVKEIQAFLDSEALGIYITDRYLHSSLAYQSLYMDVMRIESLNRSIPLPDKIIYLKVPPQTTQERLKWRASLDRLENVRTQREVASRYPYYIHRYDDQGVETLIIDATLPQEDVRKEALSFILNRG